MKICWLSWHFQTPQIFLDSIIKMTPGRSGKWKDMEAVTDPYKADYCFIMDGYNGAFPKERAIYFGEHPDCLHSFATWKDKKALRRLSLDTHVNFGEWWISHDYDTLSKMEFPQKTKKLVCVMTYQTHTAMYTQRPTFMTELVQRYPEIPLDLYGRPSVRFNDNPILAKVYKGPLGYDKPDGTMGQHLIGKEILQDYEFSLEFDVGPTKNYFSERFYDALLLFVHPVYFGSSNVHQWIPQKAFTYINIHDLNDTLKVREIVRDAVIDKDSILEARDLLLNKYQMWPAAYAVVNSL